MSNYKKDMIDHLLNLYEYISLSNTIFFDDDKKNEVACGDRCRFINTDPSYPDGSFANSKPSSYLREIKLK